MNQKTIKISKFLSLVLRHVLDARHPSFACEEYLDLLVAAPAFAAEWPKSDIPPDPSINFGVLSNGMRYAIPRMLDAGGGSIVNIGSMSGLIVNRPQWQPLACRSGASRGTVTVVALMSVIFMRVSRSYPLSLYSGRGPG